MNYEKINWTTGEKVREGYVIIDGQTYQTVQPEYTGETPINVDNLNHMDEQIYNLSNDYIVEQGGDATNGYWIKYSSGRMICYGGGSATVDITQQASGMYYAAYSFTFPQQFISGPVVIPSLTQQSGVFWISLGNKSAQTVSGGQFRIISGASVSNASVAVGYIAIGKWK